MCTQQENSINENTYILTPEEERRLKEIARDDYYRRQRSIIDRFRKVAEKATEQAAYFERDNNPELAQKATSNAQDAAHTADLLECILKKELIIDEKNDIINEQASALTQKESTIEEQACIIDALKARLNAYGIPYTE